MTRTKKESHDFSGIIKCCLHATPLSEMHKRIIKQLFDHSSIDNDYNLTSASFKKCLRLKNRNNEYENIRIILFLDLRILNIYCYYRSHKLYSVSKMNVKIISKK